MAGLFTHDDVAAFIAARRKAHLELGCAPNAHLTLNDVRGMKTQPADIVAAFHELLAAPEHRSRRLAFVVGSTFTRNQLMRAATGRTVRWFEDPAAAEAWLLEAEEEGEAAPLRRAAG